MYFTVYKITNLINNKFYIGKHRTKNLDDGYMGSGKLIQRAFNKYGVENFSKEILYVFQEEKQMNLAEKILVVPDKETNYNLCPGGQGGFGYLNKTGLNLRTGMVHSKEAREKIGRAKLGTSHTEETKKKMSEANKRTNASRGKKVSLALKGKPKSEEHRMKISAALKRKNQTNNMFM